MSKFRDAHCPLISIFHHCPFSPSRVHRPTTHEVTHCLDADPLQGQTINLPIMSGLSPSDTGAMDSWKVAQDSSSDVDRISAMAKDSDRRQQGRSF